MSSFIISIPLPAEHRSAGPPIQRAWEKEVNVIFDAPERHSKYRVPKLGSFTVLWKSWGKHGGDYRQIVTLDPAPNGERIPLPPDDKMRELGFELVEI